MPSSTPESEWSQDGSIGSVSSGSSLSRRRMGRMSSIEQRLLSDQRVNEYLLNPQHSNPYLTATIDEEQFKLSSGYWRGRNTVNGFEALWLAVEDSPTYLSLENFQTRDPETLAGLSLSEIEGVLLAGGSGYDATHRYETDIPKDFVITIGELPSSKDETHEQPGDVMEGSDDTISSSSEHEEELPINEPQAPGTSQSPRNERGVGLGDAAAATSGLLLLTAMAKLASQYLVANPSGSNDLPQNFSVFVHLYYTEILPYLQGAVREKAGPGISIGVHEKNKNERVVQIVTHRKVSEEGQLQLRESVNQLLPVVLRDFTTLSFAEGRIIRAASDVANIKYHDAKNPYQYSSVTMGDSIGSKYTGHTATAGPRIQLGSLGFHVQCYHLVDPHYKSEHSMFNAQPLITHPSQGDLNLCRHSHPPRQKADVIGSVLFHSGGLSATRVSKHGWPCIVDYAICAQGDDPKPKPNVMRMVNGEETCITDTCPVRFGAQVYAVSRSSGVQVGKVRYILTWADKCWSKAEKDTYEFTVERADQAQTEEEWNLGGLGIPGDSGAGVIDMKSSSLCGQVWGTTSFAPGTPRVAYITAWEDIVADIEEKHKAKDGRKLRPSLPQPDATSAYQLDKPLCRHCSTERKAYLSSDSVNNRLRMIQEYSGQKGTRARAPGAEHTSNARDLPVDSTSILTSGQMVQSGAMRSSAARKEEALRIVAEVFKDLPSFLSQGHTRASSLGQRSSSILGAKAEVPVVAA